MVWHPAQLFKWSCFEQDEFKIIPMWESLLKGGEWDNGVICVGTPGLAIRINQ